VNRNESRSTGRRRPPNRRSVEQPAADARGDDADGREHRDEQSAQTDRETDLVREVRRRPAVDEQVERVGEKAQTADQPDAPVAEHAPKLRQARRGASVAAPEAATRRPVHRQADQRDRVEHEEDGGPAELRGYRGAAALTECEPDWTARGEDADRRRAAGRLDGAADDVDASVPDSDERGATDETRRDQEVVGVALGRHPPPDADDERHRDGESDGDPGVRPVEQRADREAGDHRGAEHAPHDETGFRRVDAHRRTDERCDARGHDLVRGERHRYQAQSADEYPALPLAAGSPGRHARGVTARLVCHWQILDAVEQVSVLRRSPVRVLPRGYPGAGAAGTPGRSQPLPPATECHDTAEEAADSERRGDEETCHCRDDPRNPDHVLVRDARRREAATVAQIRNCSTSVPTSFCSASRRCSSSVRRSMSISSASSSVVAPRGIS